MDLVTLALAKKYADSLKGISAEQLKPVIQAYFEEHPDEIVTNAELAEQLTNYLMESDLNSKLIDYVTKADLTQTLSEYITATNLTEKLKGYLPTSDKAGISIIGNVIVIDAPSASE